MKTQELQDENYDDETQKYQSLRPSQLLSKCQAQASKIKIFMPTYNISCLTCTNPRLYKTKVQGNYIIFYMMILNWEEEQEKNRNRNF